MHSTILIGSQWNYWFFLKIENIRANFVGNDFWERSFFHFFFLDRIAVFFFIKTAVHDLYVHVQFLKKDNVHFQFLEKKKSIEIFLTNFWIQSQKNAIFSHFLHSISIKLRTQSEIPPSHNHNTYDGNEFAASCRNDENVFIDLCELKWWRIR